MAVLPIVKLGHPVLRQVARQVPLDELKTPEMQGFIDDLVETMKAANGAGLAAPQVANPVAIAAVHVEDNPRYPYKPNWPLTVFVNPVITVLSDETHLMYEGCLSVPDLRGRVPRAMHIRVQAVDRHGAPMDFEVKGLTAATFQHEFDHLEGKLFVDRVEDPGTFSTWANFDQFHKAGFVEEAIALVAKYGS